MSKQVKWTKAQEAVLWEFGSHGAEECAAIIEKRFGVSRSPDAVKRHAYRIGAPMVRYEICPDCGGKAKHLTKRGLCPACNHRELAADQKAFNEQLRAEIRRAESNPEVRNAQREHERIRQENSRLCRKHGLPSKREREYGDFAKCQKNLSKSRSDAKKFSA